MKITSFGLSFLIVSLVASLSLAMAGKPKLSEKKWDPSVRGVKLGSQYQEVISALGKLRESLGESLGSGESLGPSLST